jgi:cupin superfamily acireductone dioxygenase involved in methionine salvage
MLLSAPVLLAGCIKASASYYVDGTSDHAVTLRAEQEYFWSDAITLTLVASRMPDCQRVFRLSKVAKGDVTVELFASGENVFTVRSGEEIVQIETQGCTQLTVPAEGVSGDAIGTFKLDKKDMAFEKVVAK